VEDNGSNIQARLMQNKIRKMKEIEIPDRYKSEYNKKQNKSKST